MRGRTRIALGAVCLGAWIAAAIHPFDRQAWILENLLLVIFAMALFLLRKRLDLSTASYLAITVFILLHLAGAHYTYEHMPIGHWAKEHFHLSRNYYDRFAHGAFGFLFVFPIREVLLRFSGVRPAWGSWIAIAIILAASGVFEILESIVAEIVAPGQGVSWLAAQGDEWDAQNDMLSAFVGALVMMGAVALLDRRRAIR